MNVGSTHTTQRLARRRPHRQAGLTLVELLVAMGILSVLTTMILMSWFALQNSFGFSVQASHAREAARDAVSRMTVAVRDAQSTTYGTTPYNAIFVALRSEIDFNTTYQLLSGNPTAPSDVNTPPVRACFLFDQDKIYYLVDRDGDGLENEKASRSGKDVIVDNVVNASKPSTYKPTDVFTYTYFSGEGVLKSASSVSGTSLSKIYSVQIHVLVDLNPNRSPVYMDLKTTAQPRNLRPST